MIESFLLKNKWQKVLLTFLIISALIVTILYVVLKEEVLIYVFSFLWGIVIFWLISFFFTEWLEKNPDFLKGDLDKKTGRDFSDLRSKLEKFERYGEKVGTTGPD